VPVAVRNRPGIAAHRELVAEAEQLLRRETHRPFLPELYVIDPTTPPGQLAAGNLISGPNGQLNSNGSTFNVEVAAV
jgi:hypothetical protein